MVWTVRWRGAEGLPTRAAFSIFLSIFFLRAGAFWVYPRRTGAKRLAGGWLLFAFIGTGSSFLAFAALAAKHQIDNHGYAHKSFYYLGGLTEGSETILLFVLSCLFPACFPWFAWVFGALCWMTTFTRVWSGYLTLKSLQRQ